MQEAHGNLSRLIHEGSNGTTRLMARITRWGGLTLGETYDLMRDSGVSVKRLDVALDECAVAISADIDAAVAAQEEAQA